MTFSSRLHVLPEILRSALLPHFHRSDAAAASRIIEACGAGGARAVVFELHEPGAIRVLGDIAARLGSAGSMILGAGAIAGAGDAAQALDAGAEFVCGSGFDEAVARLCNRRRVPYIPMCAGPSEIATAEEFGVEVVALRKSRPDPSDAQALLRASPKTRLMVTDPEPLSEARTGQWLAAGVAVLGLGVPVSADTGADDDPNAVRASISRARGWVRRARGEKLFQGVEHVGLYEFQGAAAADIAAWYRDTFEWDIEEGRAYYFVAGDGPGRIEIMKIGKTSRCHLAIKVADLEEATAYLAAKGIDLVPPETRPDGRKIFFTVTDPAGNILHLLP